MANPNPSKPFVKGDPRINRKGRPRDFDALRELAQQIAHEVALKDGAPLVISGHTVTVAEAILRSWATSKNPMLQKAYLEICYGKVPDELNAGGIIEILVKYVDDNRKPPDSI